MFLQGGSSSFPSGGLGASAARQATVVVPSLPVRPKKAAVKATGMTTSASAPALGAISSQSSSAQLTASAKKRAKRRAREAAKAQNPGSASLDKGSAPSGSKTTPQVQQEGQQEPMDVTQETSAAADGAGRQ